MKKYMKLFAVVILGILLVGCNKKDKNLTIKLTSNPTTGYDWGYTISTIDIIEMTDDYISDCDDNQDGCGGKNIYTIKPLKEGKTSITFNYRSTYEKGVPEETIVYDVVVDKNLNISETHHNIDIISQ